MKWKNTTSDGLPTIGEPVILYANGVVQNAIYYADSVDNETHDLFFWASDHVDVAKQEINIQESDRWCYLSDIPKPMLGVS